MKDVGRLSTTTFDRDFLLFGPGLLQHGGHSTAAAGAEVGPYRATAAARGPPTRHLTTRIPNRQGHLTLLNELVT